MTVQGEIILRSDREKPVRQGHPWIFSGAIDSLAQQPEAGQIVTVVSKEGEFLARGYWNERSQIQVRILTWKDEAIDEDWWRTMLARAIESRASLRPTDGTPYGMRLVNAESDFLPGLIVDQYGDWLVIQALTLYVDMNKSYIADLLMELTGARGVYERSDVDIRGKEGLSSAVGVLAGDNPPERIEIVETGGVHLLVDVAHGHKTGTYLDQSENRALVGATAASIKTENPALLNLFSYTGGFSAHAASRTAISVTNVDSSGDALALGKKILAANIDKASADAAEYVQGDAFEALRKFADDGRMFDIIVCDPPKFAHNASQVDKAARGYKDLNLNSFKLIKSGGYLFTFSCSGAITADLFQKIVFGALADSGRQGQIVRHLSAGPDHPVALTFPEGAYLKGLMVRVF
ncbi:MAG: class I SAM-dependent rRNA methyltransferase [Pleurocapsa minor GSE-CHR-MK-17-07R]|nr:class I SAM-dependent rRNA methyltransferase [Pleurocapsa minor GSE-CHR-MK 17-07R]